MTRGLLKICAFSLAALCAFPPLAQAQAVCGQREMVLEKLTSHYGETRRGMGLGSNDGILEIFASDETGTWTVTMTLPDGRMCLVASGESYEDAVDPLRTSGTPL